MALKGTGPGRYRRNRDGLEMGFAATPKGDWEKIEDVKKTDKELLVDRAIAGGLTREEAEALTIAKLKDLLD